MQEKLIRPVPILGPKLIVGLFVTIVGLMLTADNLDLLDSDRVLRYWPAVILAIGILKLPDPSQRIVGAVLTVLGGSLLAFNAGWIHINIFDLWPLLLIGLGATMVARAIGLRLPMGQVLETGPSPGSQTGQGTPALNIFAILSAQNITHTSEFSGANIVAFMGGCELDLSKAKITDSPATIDAFAMWGGIEIFVPEHWEVIGEVVPFLGGFEIKTAHATNPSQQLVVRGVAFMGGIEVNRRTA